MKKTKKVRRKLPIDFNKRAVSQKQINNSQINVGTGNVNQNIIRPLTKNKTKEEPSKPFHQQWWFGRIIGAIIGGGVVSYFASKYSTFHFGDTWLGITALVATILLLRNPKRVYLRLATFCLIAIAGINILSQIDVAYKITDNTEAARPWDLAFKLGFGEEPIISVILGLLAAGLFYLDFRMRREGLDK